MTENTTIIAPQHAKEAYFYFICGGLIVFRLYHCGPIWPFGAYTDWAFQLAVGLNLHLVSPFSSEVAVCALCPLTISATSDRQEMTHIAAHFGRNHSRGEGANIKDGRDLPYFETEPEFLPNLVT